MGFLFARNGKQQTKEANKTVVKLHSINIDFGLKMHEHDVTCIFGSLKLSKKKLSLLEKAFFNIKPQLLTVSRVLS